MITEDFAAYAARVRLRFPAPVEASDLQAMLESFLGGVAMDCLEAGTRLIGHIKSMVEGGDEVIACSVTNHDARVRCRGRFEAPRAEVDVIVNVLQYGLAKRELARIVAACAARSFPGRETMTIEDLEVEQETLIRLG